jgi:hypothetical protein
VTPQIPCFACLGKGGIPLPSEYLRTLRFVEKQGEATPAAVAKATKVTHSATCNRLERLRAWGLLARWKNGRNWVYIPLGSQPQAPGDGNG